MDEYVLKQKIQNAGFEPRAPEKLIQKTVLRVQAVTMGIRAQKQLETAPAKEREELMARVLIGRLAMASDLPEGERPEGLVCQLTGQKPPESAASQGGERVKE